MTVPTIPLNSGHDIPQLGYGVFLVKPEETERLVGEALEIGYRHIDTAARYYNEEGVGRAIAASGIPRDELFITTKLANDDQGYQTALDAARASLDKLQLDYVDLYLVHWPAPARGMYVESWRACEHLLAEGLARSIGVSNFMPEHLQRLFDEGSVVPAVNQLELHPLHQQPQAVSYSRDHGIQIEAWGPIGQGKYDLAGLEPVADAASRLGATPAQVVLAWHLARERIVFPKSTRRQRMEENFAALDVRLTESELAAIDALESGRRLGNDPMVFSD